MIIEISDMMDNRVYSNIFLLPFSQISDLDAVR